MSIPVFVSQVYATATDGIGVGTAALLIPTTRSYYFISNRSSNADGKSLLHEIKQQLDAASGATFTVGLTADLRLKFSHNSGGSITVTMNRVFAWRLGFGMVFATSYPPDVTLTIDVIVPTGAGGYTAEHRSPWLWCPEMCVSGTGPELFDPMTSPGIASSQGSILRAPDGTTSTVSNGVQTDATFSFKGVQPYYRARASDPNYAGANPHEREDCETWWRFGPRLGRQFLFYRNKAVVATGTATTGATSALAPDYVIYAPDAAMRMKPSINATAPPNLIYHDITIGCTLAKDGATPMIT